jgi:hypothetical protein
MKSLTTSAKGATRRYNRDNAAKEATRIALTLAGTNKIEEATIVFRGVPFNSKKRARAKGVSLVTATIKDKPRAAAQTFTGDCIEPDLQPKIRQSLRNIGHIMRTAPPSPLVLNTVPGNGSGLDMSIAYQLFPAPPNANALFAEANKLRGLVADVLTIHAELDNDIVLLKLLVASIEAIPAFSSRNGKRGALGSLITEEEFQNIKRIIAIYYHQETDFNRMRAEERELLRLFYANYIDEVYPDGNKKNYLDIAFLYLLPKVHPTYKVAVVDDHAITSCYPEDENVDLDHWMFIHLKDPDSTKAHYSPVDRVNSRAFLDEWIGTYNQRIIDTEDEY